MAGLHGFRLLLLLLTSLVQSGVLGSSSGAALCDVSCCSVLPSCDAARVVTCDCPRLDKMIVRKGDIPETVRAFNIINTRHVTIDKDAIYSLPSLTNFILSGIDNLKIKQDGMALQKVSELRITVTIQDVRSLKVETKAFSGVWQPKTKIMMQRIGGLLVKPNAFDYLVAELGPSISVMHVKMLDLKPNGFAAPIFELNFYNVTMNACNHGSFGGNTMYTALSNVTITEAYARCFFSRNNLAAFNIRSLNMQTAYPQAFSGSIRQLLIKNSHFSTMHERSFNLHVKGMELSNTYISELRSKGLTVLASDSLMLDLVHVHYLRKNALLGLQMKRTKEEFDQALVIRKLQIDETENDSLTFSECANVRLVDFELVAHQPHTCPTEKWTRTLSGGGVSGQLTPAQYQLFYQLLQRRSCVEDSSRMFPISVENARCSARIGGGGASSRISSETSFDDWQDEAYRSYVQESSNQDSSAEDDVSREDSDADLSHAGDQTDDQGEKKVLAPEPRVETGDSPAEMGVVRRPEAPGTLTAPDSPALASGEGQHLSQHQLLVCLAVGGGVALSIVLAAVLLLLLLGRRRRGKSANGQPSARQPLVEGDRLLEEDDDLKENGGRRAQAGKTGGSFYRLASLSEGHLSAKSDRQLSPPEATKGYILPWSVGPQSQKPMVLDENSPNFVKCM